MPRRAWSDRMFRALLRIFPVEFRRDFGSEMEADFADERAAAWARGGARAARGVWLRTAADFARRGPRERLDILHRDLRYAVRVLARRPALVSSAVLTLALAIGLNTAVFSVVNGVLLRQLPAPESDRLVRLYQLEPAPSRDTTAVAPGIFVAWADRARVFAAMTLVSSDRVTLIEGGAPEELGCRAVSPGFFEVAGARLALGRAFAAGDYEADPSNVPGAVILSHELWVRRFGGHADVVGSPVRFADGPSRVVGVMPPAFFLTRLPDWGPVDCILPRLPAADQPRARYATVLARLVPGVGIANAQRELDYVAASVEREYADAFRDRGRGARVVPLLDTIVSGVRLQVWLLFAAAGAILAIGCVNITCLLLAQASDRRSELATRLALGASQGQLVRHAITEALVLAFAGGLAAALLAWWSVPLLVQWIPRGLPRVDEIAVDARVWLFALASSTVVGLACGLAGSVFAPRLPPLLSARGPGGVSAGRGRRVKQALVAGNLALAVVLLVTAGLLVRTMRAVDGLELGFVPANVISVGINTDIRQPAETLIEFESSLVDRIRALPGVLAAGIGSRPIDWGGLIYPVSLATQPDEVRLDTDVVGPGYLDALGARVIDGRSFTTDDRAGSPRVAMLNQAAAHRLFADGRAVGRTILAGSVPTTIVGVVADVRRRGLEAVPQPTLYLPTAQTRNMRSNNLLIRTAGDPTAIVPAVRAILYDLDPMQALSRIHVVDDVLDQAKAPRRFAMQLVGGFSLLAVILAMIGLYGVVAESVVQRVPEIGVRMALGATAAGIARMILTESALTMACGIGLGLAAAKALQDVMARAASLIPARRAASIDPLQALRRE